MRKLAAFFLFAAVVVGLSHAQHFYPNEPWPGRPGPTILIVPAHPAPEYYWASAALSSLDLASPALSEEERKFAILDGYVCTEWPSRYFYKSRPVSDLAFLQAVGYEDFVSSMKSYRKRQEAWGLGMFVSGIATFALLPFATDPNCPTIALPISCAACGLGFAATTIGELFNSATRPEAPGFEAVAYRANDLNRELMNKGQAK
jgi:hypothetical protein